VIKKKRILKRKNGSAIREKQQNTG